MPKAYEKTEITKITDHLKLKELDKFVFQNVGNNKVFKLTEVLEKFEPMYLYIHADARGYKYLVRLRTYEFPDGERKTGIEFIKIVE